LPVAAEEHWVCTVAEGRTVRIDSLPVVEIENIAKEAGITWLNLFGNPLRNAAAGQQLFNRCCAAAGVENRVLSARDLLTVFELTNEDGLPRTFTDGMPDPKAEEKVSTGG
jgi:hypothetical protein